MLRTNLQAARASLPGAPSASAVAKKARLSMGQLSQIERGEVRPGATARERLSKVLGLNVATFMKLWALDREAFLLRELERVRTVAPVQRRRA